MKDLYIERVCQFYVVGSAEKNLLAYDEMTARVAGIIILTTF